jgi:hypothetical protein
MMLQIQRPDVWQVGKAYESYVGRWSRLVAGAFIGAAVLNLQARAVAGAVRG